MQKILSKYGLAAHLAFVAVAPLFLFPFCGADWTARALLWLTGLAFVWLVMEPSRRSGEMLYDARLRVLSELVRDPLFWLTVCFAALAAARWANGGIRMAYDSELARWYLLEAACGILPGCADPPAGFLTFAIAIALVVLIAGCRHALGKSARISFLFTYALLAGVASVTAVSVSAFGGPEAAALTRCALEEGSFAGSAFGVAFLCGIVVVAGGLECRWNRYFLLFVFAVGANGAGLYFFAPPPVILVYLVAALLTLLVVIVYVLFTQGSTGTLKSLAAVILAAGVTALFIMGMASAELNAARTAFPDDGLLPDSYLQVRRLLSDIAVKVWKEHPWLGTGLGSFGLDVKFNLTPADWKLFTGSPACALNGWWQLLAERGIVGGICFAAAVGFLAFTFVRRLVFGFRKPFFHPSCWLGPTVLAAVVTETFVDASFLRPDLILAVGAVLALSGSSLPVIRTSGDE